MVPVIDWAYEAGVLIKLPWFVVGPGYIICVGNIRRYWDIILISCVLVRGHKWTVGVDLAMYSRWPRPVIILKPDSVFDSVFKRLVFHFELIGKSRNLVGLIRSYVFCSDYGTFLKINHKD